MQDLLCYIMCIFLGIKNVQFCKPQQIIKKINGIETKASEIKKII